MRRAGRGPPVHVQSLLVAIYASLPPCATPPAAGRRPLVPQQLLELLLLDDAARLLAVLAVLVADVALLGLPVVPHLPVEHEAPAPLRDLRPRALPLRALLLPPQAQLLLPARLQVQAPLLPAQLPERLLLRAPLPCPLPLRAQPLLLRLSRRRAPPQRVGAVRAALRAPLLVVHPAGLLLAEVHLDEPLPLPPPERERPPPRGGELLPRRGLVLEVLEDAQALLLLLAGLLERRDLVEALPALALLPPEGEALPPELVVPRRRLEDVLPFGRRRRALLLHRPAAELVLALGQRLVPRHLPRPRLEAPPPEPLRLEPRRADRLRSRGAVVERRALLRGALAVELLSEGLRETVLLQVLRQREAPAPSRPRGRRVTRLARGGRLVPLAVVVRLSHLRVELRRLLRHQAVVRVAREGLAPREAGPADGRLPGVVRGVLLVLLALVDGPEHHRPHLGGAVVQLAVVLMPGEGLAARLALEGPCAVLRLARCRLLVLLALVDGLAHARLHLRCALGQEPVVHVARERLPPRLALEPALALLGLPPEGLLLEPPLQRLALRLLLAAAQLLVADVLLRVQRERLPAPPLLLRADGVAELLRRAPCLVAVSVLLDAALRLRGRALLDEAAALRRHPLALLLQQAAAARLALSVLRELLLPQDAALFLLALHLQGSRGIHLLAGAAGRLEGAEAARRGGGGAGGRPRGRRRRRVRLKVDRAPRRRARRLLYSPPLLQLPALRAHLGGLRELLRAELLARAARRAEGGARLLQR